MSELVEIRAIVRVEMLDSAVQWEWLDDLHLPDAPGGAVAGWGRRAVR